MSRQVVPGRVQYAGQGGTSQFAPLSSSAVGSGFSMLIEEAIYRLLKADTEIISRVSGKIFSGVAKQSVAAPYIVYRSPTDGQRRRTRVLEGGATLVLDSVQVFSVGRNYGEAAELDSAVESVLDEYRGTVLNMEASPLESIDIQAIFLDNPAHGHQYVDDTKLHEFISQYNCWFTDNRLANAINGVDMPTFAGLNLDGYFVADEDGLLQFMDQNGNVLLSIDTRNSTITLGSSLTILDSSGNPVVTP